MFGDFFDGGDDIVEEIIEEQIVLDMLECGNCRSQCTCGYYGRPVVQQPVRQRLACPGRCYHGSCNCAGYDPYGNLLRMEEQIIVTEAVVDFVEDVIDGDFF